MDVIGAKDVILLDSNWVVVKQEPVAGTTNMDTDTVVKLQVGNEDDKKVLDLIPAKSPFALEMRKKREKAAGSAEKKPSAANSPTTDESKEPEPSPTSEPNPSPAVACANRKGNPGEIFVWNSYGDDQPPDAMRLGAGFVWNFRDKKCITSTEFALSTVPQLRGFLHRGGQGERKPRLPGRYTSGPASQEHRRPAR